MEGVLAQLNRLEEQLFCQLHFFTSSALSTKSKSLPRSQAAHHAMTCRWNSVFPQDAQIIIISFLIIGLVDYYRLLLDNFLPLQMHSKRRVFLYNPYMTAKPQKQVQRPQVCHAASSAD